MVERYKQGQLASPVVGTPGLDKSAGQGALAIAQASDAMNQRLGALALQAGQQQQQNFQQAAAAFHQYGAQKNYEARIQKAQDMENRRQQIQFDRLDEDNNLSNYLTDLQTKHADNPTQALDQFKTDLPLLQQQFQDRYSNDPIKLRMLMPSQRSAMMQAQAGLKKWATDTTTKNLNSRLEQMPQELEQAVGGLTGTLQEQLDGFHKHLGKVSQIYGDLKNNAVTPAVAAHIKAKEDALNLDAGKAFVNNALAQIPDGEDGMQYLKTVKAALKNPRAFGIPLDTNDHKNFVSEVDGRIHDHEQIVITGIKGQNDLDVLDARNLRAKLFQAYDDPAKMRDIAKDVEGRLDNLNKLTAQVSKEPDGLIKNTKLAGIKSVQTALIGESGQELQLQRNHEQLMRQMRLDSQRQFLIMQGQGDRLLRLADRQDRLDRQAESDRIKALGLQTESVKIQRQGVWNSDWSGILNDVAKASAAKTAAERQQQMSKVVDQGMTKLQKALHSGAIDADAYDTHYKKLVEASQGVAGAQTSKPLIFGIGGGERVLKGKELEKAKQEAERAVAALAVKHAADAEYHQTAQNMLNGLTMGTKENVILTQKLNAGLPKMIGSKTFQSKPPAQQQADLAAAVRALVTTHRQSQKK